MAVISTFLDFCLRMFGGGIKDLTDALRACTVDHEKFRILLGVRCECSG